MRAVLRDEIAKHRGEATKERAMQEARVTQLEVKRKKLLDAYYVGAVLMDHMTQEQAQISAELEHAKSRAEVLRLGLDTVEVNLEKALKLAGNWYQVYLSCGARERRQLNQAVFEKLLIMDDGDVVCRLPGATVRQSARPGAAEGSRAPLPTGSGVRRAGRTGLGGAVAAEG